MAEEYPSEQAQVETSNLLVNPSGLGLGPLEDLGGSEPEGDLLLGVLDGVGTVADVAADILAWCEYGSTRWNVR
jgi:hypothetical protein